MKKILFSIMVMLFAGATAMAQCTTLSGTLNANRTLNASTCYHLEGCFVIPDGKTLTIPAGTQILCASGSNLVVERGGKLVAIGTSTNPIVFTSDQIAGNRNRGDWGGLAIFGNAPNNESLNATREICIARSFGGTVSNDNSGTLQYLRIEYAGSQADRESPAALLLASVGSGTTIDHIQVSESAMDGFLSLGGTYNAKYLFSYNAAQTAFRFSLGNVSRQQFLLGLVMDATAHVNSFYNSNGIYIDNNINNPLNTPLTNPMLSNISVLYPIYCGTALPSTDFKNAVTFKGNGAANIRNSAFAGAKGYGLEIVDVPSVTNTANDLLNFSYNAIMSSGGAGDYSTPVSWATGCGNSMSDWINGPFIFGCEESGNDFSLSSLGYNSNLCGNYCNAAPTFTYSGTNLNGTDFSAPFNSFFTNVNYKGAIGSVDQLSSWVSTCPQDETYCSCTAPQKSSGISGIQFAPNPSYGTTVAHFSTDVTGKAQLYVLDKVTGVILRKVTFRITAPGEQQVTFSVKGLKEDVYAVRIELKNGMLNGKLLVK